MQKRLPLVIGIAIVSACGGKIDGAGPGPDGGTDPACRAVRCPPLTECSNGSCESVDPCRGISCGELVCSYGSCVNPALDEDGDGAPASSDCDDRDPDIGPGSTAECSTDCGQGTTTCSNGEWGPCSAPLDCSCRPGETRLESCGRCGSATRTCGADGRWGQVEPCQERGECAAGSTEVSQCPGGGACSRRERTCSAECTWGEWGACADLSECVPGASEQATCGNCGSQERTCSDQCLWNAMGACAGEGECAAGAVENEACGGCGQRSHTCSADCRWQAWSECGGGECNPGQVESQSCGNCGSRSRTCNAACTWDGWSGCGGEGACAPGAQESRGCDCGTETRTCSGACQWGGWAGCPGSCGRGYECSGGTCVCGPDPHFRVSGGRCLPSCGRALADSGLHNDGLGCCGGGCPDGRSETEDTWDCAYCCESWSGDVCY